MTRSPLRRTSRGGAPVASYQPRWPTSPRRQAWFFLCLLVVLVAAGCRPAALTYTVRDDAAAVTVSGRYATVGEVVAAAGLALGQGDRLSPAAGAPADPATPIAI
ncbi:MAG TPA: ubiquitin-like domain-containing protein, partial [Promineifilum sp.]|nr:ubiquitin-like domain-containing protein [Promineifilum sp.]